jgi:hypothetical protein
LRLGAGSGFPATWGKNRAILLEESEKTVLTAGLSPCDGGAWPIPGQAVFRAKLFSGPRCLLAHFLRPEVTP